MLRTSLGRRQCTVNVRNDIAANLSHASTVAGIQGNEDVVKELIHAGANMNAQTNAGTPQARPPMQWFVQMNNEGELLGKKTYS